MEEIAKHTDVDSLSITTYPGVVRRYINPLHLISHDIVLVTYEILRKELDRVRYTEYNRMFRNRKRFAYPPCPLLAIQWWRVCLDEAQMVESTTAKVSYNAPARLLQTCYCVTPHYWCIDVF